LTIIITLKNEISHCSTYKESVQNSVTLLAELFSQSPVENFVDKGTGWSGNPL